MRRPLLLSLFLLAGATGCPAPSISIEDYDRSCTLNSDCAVVTADPCGTCSCPDQGIAKTAEAAFQSDYDAANAQCPSRELVDCGPCQELAALCEAGTCTAGTTQTVAASDYDQSCTVDEDCVGVFEGDVCNTCKCPNAAIAKTAEMDYNLAFTMTRCGAPDPCAADCAVAAPTCQNGMCVP